MFNENNIDKLAQIIKKFLQARILVIGDVILDRYIWGSVERISPEAPVPVVSVKREEFKLGGAGNVAANIRALGGKPILMGVIGNDSAGEKIQSEMEKQGMSLAGMLIDLGRQTIEKTRIIGGHQQICRVDRETVTPMFAELLKKALFSAKKLIEEVDAVLISDYDKGLINQRLLGTVLPAAQKAEKIITIDPKNLDYSIYRPSTVITPNKKEAEFASGILIKNEKSLKQAAEIILAKTKTENLLITRGEDGMSLFRESGYHSHIPAKTQEVYDVTGAGDTVIAVLTLVLCTGANTEEAAIIANKAAGITVGKIGASVVEPDELMGISKPAVSNR